MENVKQINTEEGRYYSDGRSTFPSVTTIIDSVIAKPYLQKWAAGIAAVSMNAYYKYEGAEPLTDSEARSLGQEAFQNRSQEFADVGTEVHRMISEGVNATYLGSKENMKWIEKCMDNWLVFTREYDFDKNYAQFEDPFVIENEEGGYGGTIDIIYDPPKELLTIYDIKTSREISFTHALQAAAYATAYSRIHDVECAAAIIKIDKYKTQGGMEVEYVNIPVAYDYFRMCQRLYKAERNLDSVFLKGW